MNNAFVRITSLLLALFLFAVPAFCEENSLYSEGLPDLSEAKTVYFANLESGKVITRKESSEKFAPASTVKIMTGLIAIRHFEGRLDEVITVTSDMLASSKGTSMQLASGDKLSVIDLIYAVVCGGYNDAAYVLAVAVSGNIEKFISLMDSEARNLGMTDTHYTNPTGFDHSQMQTSLRDTVLLAKEAAENPIYMEISSAPSYTVKFKNNKENFIVNNRNALISTYYSPNYTTKHANGIIAGMTDNGGYCVITVPKIGDTSYLCIVMGASSRDERIGSFAIAYNLITYAKSNLGMVKLMDKDEKICEIPVDFAAGGTEDGDEFTVSAYISEDAMGFLPLSADIKQDVTYKYYLYTDRLKAPLEADTRVGGVDFYYNGEIIATVPLVIGKSIEGNSLSLSIEKAKKILSGRIVITSVISFVILTFIYFKFFDGRKKSRHSKKRF